MRHLKKETKVSETKTPIQHVSNASMLTLTEGGRPESAFWWQTGTLPCALNASLLYLEWFYLLLKAENECH